MTPRLVQAVYFWQADAPTPFKAVYGRIAGADPYSKDFHQVPKDIAKAMERSFGLPERGQTPITWAWPGEERTDTSQFKPASEGDVRSRVHWPYNAAPEPWQLSPTPSEVTPQVITGQPGLQVEADADAQLTQVQADDERPWFLAVHLFGDGPVLHARTVLENPRAGHEYASWNNLPEVVRERMRRVREHDRDVAGCVEFEEGVPVRASKIVKRIIEAFQSSPNVLLVGPPGTGKTVALEDVHKLFEGEGGEATTFDPDVGHGAFQEFPLNMEGDPRVRSLVFHPSYTYEDFVIGLLPEPVVGGQGGGVTVKPHVGPFLDLAHFASRPNRRALLICDEFNRGASAAIFGEALALLDRDKRAEPGNQATGAQVATPYHHLNPKTSDGEPLDALTSLPSSLYVLAAMNSADRSVAPLDAALRRRFSILFIEPDLELLSEHLGVSTGFDRTDTTAWTGPEEVKALAVEVLRSINERIEAVVGRDFLLGQSVFWHVAGDTRDEALRSLAAAFDNQVMGTLTLSFTDNDAALAAVLNVDPGAGDDGATTGVAAIWHQPAEAIRQVAGPRLRPVRFQDLDPDELVAALASLL